MNEDFLDAHMRHWTDAELLYAAQRWANADHLYGISAECGLKGLTETFKNGPLAGKERRHKNVQLTRSCFKSPLE